MITWGKNLRESVSELIKRIVDSKNISTLFQTGTAVTRNGSTNYMMRTKLCAFEFTKFNDTSLQLTTYWDGISFVSPLNSAVYNVTPKEFNAFSSYSVNALPDLRGIFVYEDEKTGMMKMTAAHLPSLSFATDMRSSQDYYYSAAAGDSRYMTIRTTIYASTTTWQRVISWLEPLGIDAAADSVKVYVLPLLDTASSLSHDWQLYACSIQQNTRNAKLNLFPEEEESKVNLISEDEEEEE